MPATRVQGRNCSDLRPPGYSKSYSPPPPKNLGTMRWVVGLTRTPFTNCIRRYFDRPAVSGSLPMLRTVGVSEVRRPRTRRFVTVDRGIIARGIHEPCKPSRRFLSGFSQDLLVKRRRIVAALVAAVRATAVARN